MKHDETRYLDDASPRAGERQPLSEVKKTWESRFDCKIYKHKIACKSGDMTNIDEHWDLSSQNDY